MTKSSVSVSETTVCVHEKKNYFYFYFGHGQDMTGTQLRHGDKKKNDKKMEKKVGTLSRTGHHLWSWSVNALS